MEQLRKALETRDAAAVEALLAEDVVFRSPALFKPYAGRSPRWSSCAPRWRPSRTSATCGPRRGRRPRVRADVRRAVGGRELEGADFIRLDEAGLVSEFRVMIRPMTGLIALAEAMAPRVEAGMTALS